MSKAKYFRPIVAVFCLWCSGCSAMRLSVVPPPETIQSNFAGSCGEVVVKKIPEGLEARKYGSNLSDFIVNLEKSGLVKKVYYHLPPKESVPLSLEVHFKQTSTHHPVSASIKSVAGVMSFGILFAVLRFHQDQSLEAGMDIYKDGQKIKMTTAKARSRFSGTYFDMVNTMNPKIQELGESVYKQLLAGLSDYCSEANSGRP